MLMLCRCGNLNKAQQNGAGYVFHNQICHAVFANMANHQGWNLQDA